MGIAYIIDAVRTPRGRGKKGVGRLSGLHPQELLAQALNGLRRTDFEPKDVEDVVIGCVQQAGEQGACIGRQAVLCAGWPDVVTGVSLNRFCGSGLPGGTFAPMAAGSALAHLLGRRRLELSVPVAPASDVAVPPRI